MHIDDLPPSWMDQANVDGLEAIAKTLPIGATIIEIGSFLGRSATIWAKTCDPTTRIYCIDQWNDDFYQPSWLSAIPNIAEHMSGGSYNAFLRNMSPYRNVMAMRTVLPNEAVLAQLPSADLLFYDCGKGYDIPYAILSQLVGRCRVTCGPHYQRDLYPQLVQAIDDVAKRFGKTVEPLRPTSLWRYL